MKITQDHILYKIANSINKSHLFLKPAEFCEEDSYPRDLCDYIHGFGWAILSIIWNTFLGVVTLGATISAPIFHFYPEIAASSPLIVLLGGIGTLLYSAAAIFACVLLVVFGIMTLKEFLDEKNLNPEIGLPSVVKEYYASRKNKYCVKLDWE